MKSHTRQLVSFVFILLALAISDTVLHAQVNPVPLINQPLIPTAVAPGGPQFTLTVKGTDFVAGAVVNWNGNPRTTNLVSASQLTATISASDIAVASTASITVINPAPGGGKSNTVFLSVSSPIPTFTFTKPSLNNSISVQSGLLEADFNNDGKLDLAGVRNGGFGDVVVIALGSGDGTFQGARTYQAGESGAQLVGLVAADFNGDGKLDLAVPNSFDNTVSIFLGNGDGTFQPQLTFATGTYPVSVIAADFNGDGKTDLVVSGNGGLSILLGNGDGTFQQHNDFFQAIAFTTSSLAVGDFNADGKLDLAFAAENNGGGPYIFLGNGNGTFQTPKGYATPGWPTSMTTADLNGDGKLDLIAAWTSTTSAAGGVSIFLGNGDGTFNASGNYTVGYSPVGVAVTDVNADGKLDLIVANGDIIEPSPYNNLAILLGNGDGAFQNGVNYSICSSSCNALPSGILAGDFNDDGEMDFAVPLTSGNVEIILQGAFPVMTLSGTIISFGNLAVGSSTSSQVALTNSGTAALMISSIAVTGVNNADFTESDNCDSNVAAGTKCTITIIFAPTATGIRNASILITSNAVGGAQTISLSGTGLGPVASISPSSITFPNQYVGTSGLPQTVTLTNTGSSALNIAGITASPSDFGLLSSCGNSLSVNSSCAIGVFFDPTAGGARTGTLTINDDASNNSQTVTLTGTGIDFSVVPSSAMTATITRGQTASYSLNVAPSGGFNQSVAFACTGAPAQSTCAVSPNTVALNGSTVVTVSVTVATTAASMLVHEPPVSGPPPIAVYRLVIPILGLLGLALLASLHDRSWERCPRLAYGGALLLLLCACMTLSACGGGGSGGGGGGNVGTPTGTYTLVVSATFTSGSSTLTHSTNLTLVVQ